MGTPPGHLNRSEWHYCSEDGFEISTVYMTAEEHATHPAKDRLRQIPWPYRPAQMIDPAAEAREAARFAAVKLLETLSDPIEVGGILIQPHAQALVTKLAEVRECAAAGIDAGPTVWRDAANVVHDLGSGFEAWLSAAIIAISRRATAIRQASWAAKSAAQ